MVEIRLANLTHEYDGRRALGPIGFSFGGGCLAVTGPNGSGKSTLLRIIAGLLTPTGGEAAVCLQSGPISRSALRDIVGFVSPDVHLYGDLSVFENLRFLLSARGVRWDESLAMRVLDETGLAARANDPVRDLSSGLRQRAALAAAVVHRPRLLLLDEPSTSLDDDGVHMMRWVIDSQLRDGTVVIATNDEREAAIASSRLDLGVRQ